MANITSILVFMLCGWCKNCKDKTNSLFTSQYSTCFFSLSTFFCTAVLLCRVGFCILAQEMAGPAIRNSGKNPTPQKEKKKLQVENIILDIVVAAIVFLEIARMYFDRMPAISRRKSLLFFGRQTLWYNVVFVPFLFTSHEKPKKNTSATYTILCTFTLSLNPRQF